MNDFLSEIPMYQNIEKVVELVMNTIRVTDSIESNLFNSYTALYNAGIVKKEELNTLNAWLSDLTSLA